MANHYNRNNNRFNRYNRPAPRPHHTVNVSQRHLTNLEQSLSNARNELTQLRETVAQQANTIQRITNFLENNFEREWGLEQLQRLTVDQLTPEQLADVLEVIRERRAMALVVEQGPAEGPERQPLPRDQGPARD